MKIGTVMELRLAARILRSSECQDPDLTVRLHEMARAIEAIAPGLHDGRPIDTRLDMLARDLEEADGAHGRSTMLIFD